MIKYADFIQFLKEEWEVEVDHDTKVHDIIKDSLDLVDFFALLQIKYKMHLYIKDLANKELTIEQLHEMINTHHEE